MILNFNIVYILYIGVVIYIGLLGNEVLNIR